MVGEMQLASPELTPFLGVSLHNFCGWASGTCRALSVVPSVWRISRKFPVHGHHWCEFSCSHQPSQKSGSYLATGKMPSNNWKWGIERGGNQCWWECAILRVCFLVVSCAKCFTNTYWDIFPHWVLKRQKKTIMISILHRGTKGLAERLGELPRSMKKVWNMDRISSPMPQPWYFFLSSNALFIIIRLRSLSPASKPQERFHCECLLFQWKNHLISGFEIESKCCLMDFVLGGFSHFPHAVWLWLLLWDACRVLFGIKKKKEEKTSEGAKPDDK